MECTAASCRSLASLETTKVPPFKSLQGALKCGLGRPSTLDSPTFNQAMNAISQTLTMFFARMLRVLLWVAAAMAAFTVALMVLMSLALAGAWALLTGRRVWWTQLRHMQKTRGAWRFGTASTANANSAGHATKAEQTAPFARRRFGHANQAEVTDVSPRKVHP